MYIIETQLFNHLERSILLKKLNIFLLVSTILSISFYVVFYNFIEKVEYSASTDERLYKNVDFIAFINTETKNEKTGEYYYKLIVTRSEYNNLKRYKQAYAIKELPPTKTIEFNCKPNEVCTSVAWQQKTVETRYMSEYILYFSFFLLVLIIYFYRVDEKEDE
jgi:hypothetical protein